MSGRLGPISVTTVLLGLLAAGGLADTIRLVDGTTREDVKIVKETYQAVEFRVRGISAAQTYSNDKVAEVLYKRWPSDYREGRTYMADGDYETAFSLFMSVANSTRSGDALARQYAYFNAAECRRLSGEFDEAIKVYNDLLSEIPETRFYGQASIRKAECYQALSKNDQALIVVQKLRKDADEKGLGDRWKYAAELALVEMNPSIRADEALRQLMSLHGKTKDRFPQVANKARLAIGSVYIKQQDYAKAEKFFQEIIDQREGTSEDVVAGAYNGLGETLMLSSTRRDDQKQALFAFLRVIYHYQNVRSQHARAMYWAGKIFKVRGERGRAHNLLNRCINEFPGTRWAELAKKEI